MTVNDIRTKYLEFFKARGHVEIPSTLLIPDNDPTTLFTGSGMQPLLPYLLGEPHPAGVRVADSQRCFRAEDIEEVGDNRHTTFFEMLGNWSFGDYFKQEQLPWFFEFLTVEIGLDPKRLYVTVFGGDEKNNLPKDSESAEIWKRLFKESGIEANVIDIGTVEQGGEKGMQDGRVFYYGSKKNWWSRFNAPDYMPAGEPGGPDSEVFYEFINQEHDPKYGEYCHPNCDCGRFVEIGNSVFMQYRKKEDGTFELLPKKNVDFGGGLERIAMASGNSNDMFRIDAFVPIIARLETLFAKKYGQDTQIDRAMRIIADHIRSATFMVSDGIAPSNKDRGYVLRRLIRKIAFLVYQHKLQGTDWIKEIADEVIDYYREQYPELAVKRTQIHAALVDEVQKFYRTVEIGAKMFEKVWENTPEQLLDELPTPSRRGAITPLKIISGSDTSSLSTTYGFPMELTTELARERGGDTDLEGAREEFKKHQELSRAGAQKKFGGHGLLLDNGEIRAGDEAELKKATRLHTATHMLQQALREVLGAEVRQAGSDITADRTRFDYTFSGKPTPEQLRHVEEIVNRKVKEDLGVTYIEMPREEAEKTGALFFFKAKYGDRVKVYYMGDTLESAWSKEFCGGPHVTHTGDVGHFRITKDESIGVGYRRIRAIIEP